MAGAVRQGNPCRDLSVPIPSQVAVYSAVPWVEEYLGEMLKDKQPSKKIKKVCW